MSKGDAAAPGSDPFTQFWTDAMGRMAAAGAASAGSNPDPAEQMRRTFFSALAEYSDQYMRSEQFLKAMKQTLDNSLALKQQINQFLTQSLQSAQMPSRSDTDHIVLLLRGLEDRVMGKLEELSNRVEALEAHRNGAPEPKRKKSKPQPRSKQ